MSYLLPHLRTGWAVDQAILNEEDRVVVVRFGHDYDPVCMQMDEALSKIADKVKNFCVVYLVDITEVPDFNTMYELYDPCTVMTFFRNKHIMIDLVRDSVSFPNVSELQVASTASARCLVASTPSS